MTILMYLLVILLYFVINIQLQWLQAQNIAAIKVGFRKINVVDFAVDLRGRSLKITAIINK